MCRFGRARAATSRREAVAAALQLVDVQLGGAATVLLEIADAGSGAVGVGEGDGIVDHACAVAEALVPVLDAHPVVALAEAQRGTCFHAQGRGLGGEAAEAGCAA